MKQTNAEVEQGDPWCKSCESYHPVPRDAAHKAALMCEAGEVNTDSPERILGELVMLLLQGHYGEAEDLAKEISLDFSTGSPIAVRADIAKNNSVNESPELSTASTESGNTETGLLPCPFCGGEALGGTAYTACSNSGCQMSLRPLMTSVWQSRADIASKPDSEDVEAAWHKFIESTEAAHFRTPYDTGANMNALFIWNLVRDFAGMDRLTLKDLQLRAGYSDEQMAENERMKRELNEQ